MVAAAEIEQVEADAARPQVLNHCQRSQKRGARPEGGVALGTPLSLGRTRRGHLAGRR